jgi:4-hydroxy-tetrahydrodipicolinate reductase
VIKVGVLGARGRMGSEVGRALAAADDLELAAEVDEGNACDELTGCAVVVDFTHPGVVMDNLRWCVGHGLDVVVGTSGFDADRLAQVRSWLADAPSVRVLIAANFSVGAVLMMKLSTEAAKVMPHVEIIELHHETKKDAPSGTAKLTARRIAEAGGPKNVPIHSVRLPGYVAHQEVLFGGLGETLTIRHDSLSRDSFGPGIVLAVRNVRKQSGLTIGLESLLFPEASA